MCFYCIFTRSTCCSILLCLNLEQVCSSSVPLLGAHGVVSTVPLLRAQGDCFYCSFT